MAKAMLIMDMPSSCKKCRYSVVYARKNKLIWKCCLELPVFIENDDINKRQDWCPLREVPQKKEKFEMDIIHHESLDLGKRIGYNACIDEILGGDE